MFSSYVEVKTVSPTLICFLVYLFIVDSTCLIGSRVLGYLAQYYYSGFKWLLNSKGLSG